ncbi:MAG: hypothetical protein QXZ12_01370 [Thermoplasmata archaeon]
MDENINISELKEMVKRFCDERDWDKFHTAKDLANILQNIKGKYLMNINNDDFVIDTFGAPSLEKEYLNMCDLTKNAHRSRRVELFYWN